MSCLQMPTRILLRAHKPFPAFLRNIHLNTRLLSDLYFTEKHEWIKIDPSSKIGTVGISEYAEQKLGDIVFVELPEKDHDVRAQEQCGIVESVKAVSEVYSPASGKVVEVNPELQENTSIINKSPMEKGWLFKMSLSEPEELKKLMSEEKYKVFLESEH